MATPQHRPTKPQAADQEPPHPPVARPLVDGRDLHPRLQALLHRVQAAERTAVGPQRRPTFRLMREVLAASVRLGVPIHLLAECLDKSRESVRNRASGLDGTITPELIKQLTDLTPAQLDRLSRGELTRHADQADRAHHADPVEYLTTDVVRALLNTPRPRIKGVAGRARPSRTHDHVRDSGA
jgi:hypothetical protein